MINRAFKQVFLILFFSVLVVFFQNCRQIEVEKLDPEKATKVNGSGGGTGVGYDGKLIGSYYRFIPGYACSGQPAAKEIINISDYGSVLLSNSILQCAASTIPLPLSEIGRSPLQTEFINYKDIIFKRIEGEVITVPDQLPEVLCRDDFDNPTIEIVTHYNSTYEAAIGREYVKTNDGRIIGSGDFSVARAFSPYQIIYQSDRMLLEVDTQNPISGTRRFNGKYSNELTKNRPVTCVSGGILDSSAWPLRQITDFRVTSVTVNYNTNTVVITKEDAEGSMAGRRLLQLKSNGQFLDLTTELLNSEYEVNSLTSSYGETPLVLAMGVKNTGPYVGIQHFFIDLLNLKILPFGNPGEVLRSNPTPLRNGEMIFSAIETKGYNTVVRKLNLETGQMTDVYKNFGVVSQVIPNTNTVVTMSSSTNSSVVVHDFVEGTQESFTPPIASTCYPSSDNVYSINSLYGKNSVFTVFPKVNMAVVRYNCYQAEPVLYAVSLSKSTHVNFGKNACILEYSTEYNWIEIGHETSTKDGDGVTRLTCKPINAFHYNFNDGTSFSLGDNVNYSADRYKNLSTSNVAAMYGNTSTSQSIYYGTARYTQLKLNESINLGLIYSSDKPQLIEFNHISNQTREVCERAKGKIVSIGSLKKSEAYLLTSSAEEKIYYVYKVTPDECILLNSFPSNKNRAIETALAPSGLGIILGDDRPGSPNSVYFVPFNGKPTYLLNLYEQDIYTAVGFKINSNTRELFLKGKPKDGKIDVLYKFTLPEFMN